MIKKNRLVVKVGDISVGGQHPVVIQSMTNTDTADIAPKPQNPTTKECKLNLVNSTSWLLAITSRHFSESPCLDLNWLRQDCHGTYQRA